MPSQPPTGASRSGYQDLKDAIHGALTAPEQTLLGRVAAGDPAAVRECIASFGPLVWSIARRFRASDDEAAQLCADMFGALWQQVGRYDPGVASEPVFVTMVARRCAIEQLRASASRPARRVDDALDGADVHDEFARCSEALIATSVLATLDPRQRRAVSLAIGQAMTHGEVADANDMTPASAKSLLRRALVAVRKRVQARQGEAP